jgi:transcriptional regulator with XRE-family HTH domain
MLDVRTCAEQAGIDHTYWRKLEAGLYRSPDPRHLKSIADVLDVPLIDLYGLCGYETAQGLPSLAPYLRSKYTDLPPEAVRDLEQYFEMLRLYYDIPADQPVFPPKPRRKPTPQRRAQPSKDAKNDKNHPWRGAA